MTQNTPIYGLPYPEFSDAPDGPTQIHNLALAVETVVNALNVRVTSLETSRTANEGAWTSWTPTFTSVTLGNGVVVAKYKQIGKTVYARFSLIAGSTTVFTASTVAISLPVSAAADYLSTSVPIGPAWLLDNSAGVSGRYAATAIYWNTAGGSVYFVSSVNTALAHAGSDSVASATSPFTFAINDQIAFSVVYEAA